MGRGDVRGGVMWRVCWSGGVVDGVWGGCVDV